MLALGIIAAAGTAAANQYRHQGDLVELDVDPSTIVVRLADELRGEDPDRIRSALAPLNPATTEILARDGLVAITLDGSRGQAAAIAVAASLDEVAGAWPVYNYEGVQQYVTDEIIIGFRDSAGDADRDRILGRHGLRQVGSIAGFERLVVAKLIDFKTTDAFDVSRNLAEESRVDFAHPNFVKRLHAAALPNDPQLNNQWALNNTGQSGGTTDADIDMFEGWRFAVGGESTIVAVLDEGFDLDHEDLDGKFLTGYDAVDNDDDPRPNPWDPHGTACAGIIAAETDNNLGIAGISWGARILPIRIAESPTDGADWVVTDEGIATGILEAVNRGADILSNSWGGGSPSDLITFAVNYATEFGRGGLGCVVVFSSGNDNGAVNYPATLGSVIAVGATNQDDERCTPTDWGPGQGSNSGPELDIVAPGNDIETTDITGADGYDLTNYTDSFGGTSAACPYVAGVAALLLSVNPAMTADEVQQTLEDTADDEVGDPGEDTVGWDQFMGHGRLNAHAALESIAPVIHLETIDGAGEEVGTYSQIILDDAGQLVVVYYAAGTNELRLARDTGTWQIEAIDSSGNAGGYGAIAPDDSGELAVSYYDQTLGALRYAGPLQLGGSATIGNVDAPGGFADVGQYTDMLVDDAGRLQVSYYDVYNADLKLAIWDGSWTTSTVVSAGSVGQYSSLYIDDSGRYGLSFYDADLGALRYTGWLQQSWSSTLEPVQLTGGYQDVGQYNQLHFDQQGRLAVSYYDVYNENLRLATRDGSWSSEVIVSTGAVGKYASHAFDNSGQRSFSYYDEDLGALRYAGPLEQSWSSAISSVDAGGGPHDVGTYNRLLFDENGNLLVIYRDEQYQDLKMAVYDGGWQRSTIVSEGNVGQYGAIAVHSDGRRDVSYYDADLGALRYAGWLDQGWSVTLEQVQETFGYEDVGQYATLLNNDGQLIAAYYDSYNQDVRYAERGFAGWDSYPIMTSGDVGKYLSLAIDDIGRKNLSCYYADDQELWYAGSWAGDVVTGSSVYFHLGAGTDPPCEIEVAESSAGAISTDLFLSGPNLAALQETGASLAVSAMAVETGYTVPLAINGHAVTPIPSNPECDPITHYVDVTPYLNTGQNTITLGPSADDCVIGNVRILPLGNSLGDIVSSVQSAFDTVTFSITNDGQAFDGVAVLVYENGQEVRSGRPSDGGLTFDGLVDGTYHFEVRPVHESGGVLNDGDFAIDLSNMPPSIDAQDVDPDTVPNTGDGEVLFSVTASDTDGTITDVRCDLRQIGGTSNVALTAVGGGRFELSYTVPAGVSSGGYQIPFLVSDDRGASIGGTMALSVTPAGGYDDLTVTACGFTAQASLVEDLGGGDYRAAGNVRLTHDATGLALTLDAGGAVIISTTTPSISADGVVTLRADLQEFGTLDLYQGEFSIDAAGNLSIEGEAQALLDDVAGWALDPETVQLDLILSGTPGLLVNAHVVLDEIDGVIGNDSPTLEARVTVLVDGSLDIDAALEEFELDLAAGDLSVHEVSWDGEAVVVDSATFALDSGTFQFGESPPTFTLSEARITSEGLEFGPVGVSGFDEFTFGGFTFAVEAVSIGNDFLAVDRASVVFPVGGENTTIGVEDILIANGQLTLGGGEIRVPPLKVGSYDLGGVYAHFSQEDDHYVLEGSGELAIPSFATVGIAFTLDSSCQYLLTEFCMAAELPGQGIPIGSTGFLLTDIGGCLATPDCNGWEIRFMCGLSSADRINPPDLSIIAADVEMSVVTDPFRFGAFGTVELVGIQLGSAGFYLYPDRFHGWGVMNVPEDPVFLTSQSDLEIRWAPQFAFRGTTNGRLQIPAEVIPLYDEDVVLSEFGAAVDNEHVAGDFEVIGLNFTFEYFWDGEYRVSLPSLFKTYYRTTDGRRFGVRSIERFIDDGAAGAPALQPLVWRGTDQPLVMRASSSSAMAANGSLMGLVYRDSLETATVAENSGPVAFVLAETLGTELAMTLQTPSGLVVDPEYCESHDGFDYHATTDIKNYVVASPEAGTWTVAISEIDDGEEYTFQLIELNRDPRITVLQPTGDVTVPPGGTTTIRWSASDPDDDPVTVDVMVARVDAGPMDDAGPWLLAEDLPVDEFDTFDWNPHGFRAGQYQVVARAVDWYGRSAADTTTATITVEDAGAPARPSGTTVRVGPGSLRVSWDLVNDPWIRGYRILYAADGQDIPDTMTAGLVSSHVLSSLENYTNYQVRVQALDLVGRYSEPSNPAQGAPSPLGDIQAPAIPEDFQVANYDPVANVATLSWLEPEDAVRYRIHYDTKVVGPYAGVGASEGASPVLQGRASTLTLSGLRRGRQYYVCISAIDAAGNESRLSAPVPLVISEFVDTDGDGLPDDWEIEYFGDIQPYSGYDDPDRDGLDNLEELELYHTNPILEDSDGDRISDGVDPDPLSAADNDQDGMADDWEVIFGGPDHPDLDPVVDHDDDGLENLREYSYSCLPFSADTDLDGLLDGYEVDLVGCDPLNNDTDGGGRWDGYEYVYGLDPLDPSDDDSPVGVADGAVPRVTEMYAPAPNPFNAKLGIRYAMSRKDRVVIQIFDVRGHRVRTLVDEEKAAGRYSVIWDGRDDHGHGLASSVYFVRFQTAEVTSTSKVTLVK